MLRFPKEHVCASQGRIVLFSIQEKNNYQRIKLKSQNLRRDEEILGLQIL